MGSGVLLAILVALWFIVLVPMVVTRGDLAATPAEPMRVLRRRSDRSPMSSSAMSSAEQATGHNVASHPDDPNMHTEPIPVLPRRVPGATIAQDEPPAGARPMKPAAGKPGIAVKPGPAEQQVASTAMRELIARGEIDIRARRRRMLSGLIALAVLWALFAAFWQPVLWWPQIILDLVVFSYLVFLRLEAQREQDRQERRRARAATRVSLPEDRTQRLVRKHTEYQAHVTAATGNQTIAIDDDDPGLAEMPTWDSASNGRLAAEAPAWHERKAV